jgi:hypothetical protein
LPRGVAATGFGHPTCRSLAREFHEAFRDERELPADRVRKVLQLARVPVEVVVGESVWKLERMVEPAGSGRLIVAVD